MVLPSHPPKPSNNNNSNIDNLEEIKNEFNRIVKKKDLKRNEIDVLKERLEKLNNLDEIEINNKNYLESEINKKLDELNDSESEDISEMEEKKIVKLFVFVLFLYLFFVCLFFNRKKELLLMV